MRILDGRFFFCVEDLKPGINNYIHSRNYGLTYSLGKAIFSESIVNYTMFEALNLDI